MADNVIFQETQRFRQWWVWLIALVPAALSIGGLLYQETTGKPFGNNPAASEEYIVIIATALLVPLLFLVFKLETKITGGSVSYRFFPFHMKWRVLTFDQIRHWETRTYKPLAEYGGWGLRYGSGGWCYNVSGNKGLQLVKQDGKRLLIGTQRPEELASALNEVFPQTPAAG